MSHGLHQYPRSCIVCVLVDAGPGQEVDCTIVTDGSPNLRKHGTSRHTSHRRCTENDPHGTYFLL